MVEQVPPTEATTPEGGAVFNNPPVLLSEIPALSAERFEPVVAAYLRLRVVTVLVFMAVLAGVVMAVPRLVSASVDVPTWATIAGLVGIVVMGAITIWIHTIDVRRMGYQVRTHDFSFRRGVLWRRVDTMPFARVQHVVIRRGPIERAFGLATLHLRSAGGSLLVIGLDADGAQQLRSLVVERAGALADQELVNADG